MSRLICAFMHQSLAPIPPPPPKGIGGLCGGEQYYYLLNVPTVPCNCWDCDFQQAHEPVDLKCLRLMQYLCFWCQWDFSLELADNTLRNWYHAILKQKKSV